MFIWLNLIGNRINLHLLLKLPKKIHSAIRFVGFMWLWGMGDSDRVSRKNLFSIMENQKTATRRKYSYFNSFPVSQIFIIFALLILQNIILKWLLKSLCCGQMIDIVSRLKKLKLFFKRNVYDYYSHKDRRK